MIQKPKQILKNNNSKTDAVCTKQMEKTRVLGGNEKIVHLATNRSRCSFLFHLKMIYNRNKINKLQVSLITDNYSDFL